MPKTTGEKVRESRSIVVERTVANVQSSAGSRSLRNADGWKYAPESLASRSIQRGLVPPGRKESDR